MLLDALDGAAMLLALDQTQEDRFGSVDAVSQFDRLSVSAPARASDWVNQAAPTRAAERTGTRDQRPRATRQAKRDS